MLLTHKFPFSNLLRQAKTIFSVFLSPNSQGRGKDHSHISRCSVGMCLHASLLAKLTNVQAPLNTSIPPCHHTKIYVSFFPPPLWPRKISLNRGYPIWWPEDAKAEREPRRPHRISETAKASFEDAICRGTSFRSHTLARSFTTTRTSLSLGFCSRVQLSVGLRESPCLWNFQYPLRTEGSV